MLIKVSMDTIETTATVLLIVAAASIFGWLLTVTRVTDAVAALGAALHARPGDVPAAREYPDAVRRLLPRADRGDHDPGARSCCRSVHQLGIDPVHFGLVMVLNLMIGLLHPPMGMVLFVLARVAKLSIERTTMAILPWLVPLLGSLILITYVPSISMWLPRTLMP